MCIVKEKIQWHLLNHSKEDSLLKKTLLKTLLKIGIGSLIENQGDETSPGDNPSNIENGVSVKLAWQGSC